LRANGLLRIGSMSSHSAVAMAENCPSLSQCSQKPPTALTAIIGSSAAPVHHEKRRNQRQRPYSASRSRCRIVKTTKASAA
jgi:hypothetical protein